MGALAKGVGIATLVVLMLAGCSVPGEGGIRLNADNTVDFVMCGTPSTDVIVNYMGGKVSRNFDDYAWEGTWANTNTRPEPVVTYGDPRYQADVLRDPPDDWTRVYANGLYAERTELVVGEWVWFTNEPAWVPGRPCIDLPAEGIEEP